jgi:hypothetical protein
VLASLNLGGPLWDIVQVFSQPLTDHAAGDLTKTYSEDFVEKFRCYSAVQTRHPLSQSPQGSASRDQLTRVTYHEGFKTAPEYKQPKT